MASDATARAAKRGSPVSYVLMIIAIAAAVMLWVSTSHRARAYTQGMHIGSPFGPLCSPGLENYCLREFGNLDSFHRQVQRLQKLANNDEDWSDDDGSAAAAEISANSSASDAVPDDDVAGGRRLRSVLLEDTDGGHPLEMQRQQRDEHHSSGCMERTADKRAELMMSLGALKAQVGSLMKEVRDAEETAGQLAVQAASESEAKERAQRAEAAVEVAQAEVGKWRAEAEAAQAALKAAHAEVAKLKEEAAASVAVAKQQAAEVETLKKQLQEANGKVCPKDQSAEVEGLKKQLMAAAAKVCPKCTDQGPEVERLRKELHAATAAARQWEEKARGAEAGRVALNTSVVLGAAVAMGSATQSMVVPRNDEGVGAWLVAHKAPAEGSVLQKLLAYIKPGDVVVDVGANLGGYAVWFARLVGEGGRVWAFEPQPYIYQMLCTNTIINGHRHVQTVNAALSFKRGMANLEARVRSGAAAGRNFSDAATDLGGRVDYGARSLGVGGERVPTLTLDSLKLARVALMKVHVVGTEALVVWGAKETIQRAQPVVSLRQGGELAPELVRAMEIPAEVAAFRAAAWLASIGYRHAETVEQDQLWVPRDWKP